MIVNKRESKSYVCTLDTSSPADMSYLQSLRTNVSLLNKTDAFGLNFRNQPAKKRVVIRGRKPKVKQQVQMSYWTGNSKGEVSYDHGGNIVGGIKNARYLDVYIYDRITW